MAISTTPPRVGWYQVLMNDAKHTEELMEVTKWDAKIVQAGDFAIPQKFYIFNNYAQPNIANGDDENCADMINCHISVRDMKGGLGTGSPTDPSLEGQQLGNALTPGEDPNNPYGRDFTGDAITGGGKKGEPGTRATVYMVMYNGSMTNNLGDQGAWGVYNPDTEGWETKFDTEADITDGDSALVNNPNSWQMLNSAADDARKLCNAKGQPVEDDLDDAWNISGKRINITAATYGSGEGQNIWDVNPNNERMANCAVVYLTLHANSEAAAGTVMWRTRVSYQFR